MSHNILPEAPKHRGVDPLTTGKTYYGAETEKATEKTEKKSDEKTTKTTKKTSNKK